MIAGAVSSYQREIMKGGSTNESVDNAEVRPESIPLIHIAYQMIRNRIAFVKEAFELGFILSRRLSNNIDTGIKRPEECYQLRDMDFGIFESILNQSLETVSTFLENTDVRTDMKSVYKYQYLIEENIHLFNRDFSKELVSLRLFFLYIFLLDTDVPL